MPRPSNAPDPQTPPDRQNRLLQHGTFIPGLIRSRYNIAPPPLVTLRENLNLPTIPEMVAALERLKTKDKRRNRNEAFIKEIIEQLLGPTPSKKQRKECTKKGHHFGGYTTLTGRKYGLLSGIGCYYQNCFVEDPHTGVISNDIRHRFPLTQPLTDAQIQGCGPLVFALEKREQLAPGNGVRVAVAKGKGKDQERPESATPSPSHSNATYSPSASTYASSSSATKVSLSSSSLSAKSTPSKSTSSSSLLSPTTRSPPNQNASPPTIPSSAISDADSDDCRLFGAVIEQIRRKKDQKRKREVIDLTSDTEDFKPKRPRTLRKVVDPTSDLEPSQSPGPRFFDATFYDSSLANSVVVELAVDRFGMLNLSSIGNVCDTRIAGIRQVDQLLLLDQDSTLDSPTWLTVFWDIPFAVDTNKPVVLIPKEAGAHLFD